MDGGFRIHPLPGKPEYAGVDRCHNQLLEPGVASLADIAGLADPVLTAKYAAMVSVFVQAVQPIALVSAWLRPHVAETVRMTKYALMASAFVQTAQRNAMIGA